MSDKAEVTMRERVSRLALSPTTGCSVHVQRWIEAGSMASLGAPERLRLQIVRGPLTLNPISKQASAPSAHVGSHFSTDTVKNF